jgi:hypothetical protein
MTGATMVHDAPANKLPPGQGARSRAARGLVQPARSIVAKTVLAGLQSLKFPGVHSLLRRAEVSCELASCWRRPP